MGVVCAVVVDTVCVSLYDEAEASVVVLQCK
jgi:hypothetical protein